MAVTRVWRRRGSFPRGQLPPQDLINNVNVYFDLWLAVAGWLRCWVRAPKPHPHESRWYPIMQNPLLFYYLLAFTMRYFCSGLIFLLFLFVIALKPFIRSTALTYNIILYILFHWNKCVCVHARACERTLFSVAVVLFTTRGFWSAQINSKTMGHVLF